MKHYWKECLWFKGWGKIGYTVLGFKARHRSSKGRVKSKGLEKARIFDSNQAFAKEF